jgi:hypothetical protein
MIHVGQNEDLEVFEALGLFWIKADFSVAEIVSSFFLTVNPHVFGVVDRKIFLAFSGSYFPVGNDVMGYHSLDFDEK